MRDPYVQAMLAACLAAITVQSAIVGSPLALPLGLLLLLPLARLVAGPPGRRSRMSAFHLRLVRLARPLSHPSATTVVGLGACTLGLLLLSR